MTGPQDDGCWSRSTFHIALDSLFLLTGVLGTPGSLSAPGAIENDGQLLFQNRALCWKRKQLLISKCLHFDEIFVTYTGSCQAASDANCVKIKFQFQWGLISETVYEPIHNWNFMEFHFALILIQMIQSGHEFAHANRFCVYRVSTWFFMTRLLIPVISPCSLGETARCNHRQHGRGRRWAHFNISVGVSALTKPAVSHFLRRIYSLSKEEAL